MRPANATARYRRITPDPVLCKNTFGSIENRALSGPSGLSRNLCSLSSRRRRRRADSADCKISAQGPIKGSGRYSRSPFRGIRVRIT
jgi:hypothetical protein